MYILAIVFVIYVIYTLNFSIKFNRTNTIFNNNQLLLHNLLIWIIPFFWIVIIKAMIKPTPGSSKFKKTKAKAGFYDESGIGTWGHDDGHIHHSDEGHGHHGDD
jgi:magnesium-transporting ATPase (P-type)